MKSLPILAAILLSSCAVYSPSYNASMVAKKSDRELLEYWHRRNKAKIAFAGLGPNRHIDMHQVKAREEVLRRGLVRPSAVDEIEETAVAIGMTPNEASAAWGWPEDINSTVTTHGSRDQWVYGGYRNGTWTDMRFVYFERGRVVGIQN